MAVVYIEGDLILATESRNRITSTHSQIIELWFDAHTSLWRLLRVNKKENKIWSIKNVYDAQSKVFFRLCSL